MRTPNSQNLQLWIGKSEIDYFAQFIKAFIPFNAWYRNSYDQVESEREIVNLIKSDGNVIRGRIVRLLGQLDEEAMAFKSHLALLHNRLENNEISNKGNRITFTNCYIGDNRTNNVINEMHRGITYRLERSTTNTAGAGVLCEILSRSNAQRFLKLQTRYDLADLQADPAFTELPIAQQDQLAVRYRRINPRLELNLLDVEEDSTAIGTYLFCNNQEYIFAGLVEIIYSLRCILFHGEVVPTQEINSIYEPAYHILRRFLQSIV